MAIEERNRASVVTHALAQQTLTDLRSVDTGQVAFREGLVDLGRICGYELVDARFETGAVTVQTPLAEATGQRVEGLDDVVLVTVLRAATPFVDGLLEAFPAARQGIISASRDESSQRADGTFPLDVQYVKLPDIEPGDTVVVADPMLATGSTLVAVLDAIRERGDPDRLLALSAVSAPAGIDRVTDAHPETEVITVAVDDHLDDDGFIVPGLGDAGDRAFGTSE